MGYDILVGALLILGALGGMVCLTLWSSRSIDRIAENRDRSAREIIKDRGNG